ncbi:hypothetical protein [Paenibacillus lutrae]|nr:hypothetical protein [Paenibacillus lutrae]
MAKNKQNKPNKKAAQQTEFSTEVAVPSSQQAKDGQNLNNNQ